MLYPSEPPQEAIYLPFRQEPRGSIVLVIDTDADSASALTPVSEMLRRMDPDVPIYDVQTIEAFYTRPDFFTKTEGHDELSPKNLRDIVTS